MVHRAADAQRGLDPSSDLWSPGYFTVLLSGGETVFLTACVNDASAEAAAVLSSAREKSRPSLEESLSDSLCAFLVKRGAFCPSSPVIPGFSTGTGFPDFRPRLIGIGKIGEAKAILRLFGGLEDRGTLPNMISGKRTENRTTVDASLWFLAALADLTASEKSNAFLDTISGGRSLRDIALSIGRFYIAGTPGGVRMDPASNLIYSPACFTWMDTNHPAARPSGLLHRDSGLWHKALVFLSASTRGAVGWAAGVRRGRRSRTCCARTGYLADCLTASPGESAASAHPDAALRPIQLLALTLDAVTDRPIGKSVLDACQTLLVPGAIRSLADEPEQAPAGAGGAYRGRYAGDEDTSRKPAYHNGTAWTWLFPHNCEAYAIVYGEKGKIAARSWLAGSFGLLGRTASATFRKSWTAIIPTHAGMRRPGLGTLRMAPDLDASPGGRRPDFPDRNRRKRRLTGLLLNFRQKGV
jgi:glycogen debranching enzyme